MLTKKTIGQTDIALSPLGLGTVKFGRNTQVKYPTQFELPSDSQCIDLLNLAYDLGINLLDTAPAYGTSESRLGKLLKNNRNNWVIVSKAGEVFENNSSSYDFTPDFITNSIKSSLFNLKTDYVDILLIHSNGDDENIIKNYDVFGTLDQLKRQGLIRAYGMSSKTIEGGLLSIEHADVAMVEFNQQNPSQLPVLEKAKELNKGILIKKSFGSGHLDINQNLEFITKHYFNSIIMGTISPTHLKENIQIMENFIDG